MRLFLTSYYAFSQDKVLPLLHKKPSELKVAFIPTASDLYKYRPWIDIDREALTKAGFSVFDVGLQAHLDADGYPVVGRDKQQEELRAELIEADIIFVAGGNTFYLLEQAQKSGFLEVAREMIHTMDKTYIGSSAGSVFMGPDIMPVEFFDPISETNIKDTTGMHVVDFVILPHFVPGEKDPSFEETIKKYGQSYELLTLANEDFVHVDEKGYKIF